MFSPSDKRGIESVKNCHSWNVGEHLGREALVKSPITFLLDDLACTRSETLFPLISLESSHNNA